MPYVSITGLKLKARRHVLTFWWHAIPSMLQARSAPGHISSEARTINGVHHTVTVWEDAQAMRRYLLSGAHLKAMKVFPRIATGKTFGFMAESAPPWSDVPDIWNTHGQEF